jgi:hypothetical protein
MVSLLLHPVPPPAPTSALLKIVKVGCPLVGSAERIT